VDLGFVDIDDVREGNIMISTFSFGRAHTFARATRELMALTATLSFFISNSNAATFIVNRTDDRNLTTANCLESATTPDCAIREALTAASANGGTNAIVISPGLLMTLTIGTPLNVTGSSLTIEGNGATIRRSDFQDTPKFRILDVSVTELAINDLTIANGNVDYNTAGIGESGGGIKVKPNVTVTLKNCRVIGNRSSGRGAGIFNEGTVKLIGSTVSSNQISVGNDGGGIFVSSGATLETSAGTVIAGNIAGNAGGGIAVANGTAKIVDSEINGNSATFGGGVALRIGNLGRVELVNSLVKGNFADPGTGGGVYQDSGTLEIATSTLESNVATSGLANGSEGLGGGLAVRNIRTFITSTAIRGSRIRNNLASWQGGGIYTQRTIAVRDSIISGNTGRLSGGAIYMEATASVSNTTLSENEATFGGAIYAAAFSFLNMINGTVSRNVTLPGSTAVVNAGSFLQVLRNSIIAGNTEDLDVLGAFQSLGHNLIGNVGTATGFSAALHDIIGTATNPVDAKLRPLGSYGGSTETQPPLSDSPAIDAGNNCVVNQSCATDDPGVSLAFDQRQKTRIGGTANFTVDIGAVELQTGLVINRNNSGSGSLRDLIDDPYRYDQIAFGDTFLTGSLPISLSTPISIERPLEMLALASQSVIVSGSDSTRAFQIGVLGDVIVKNLAISDGNASAGEGGNIRNAGTLRMENCAFRSGMSAANGGAIANVAGAKLFIDRCGFTGNSAGTTGGAIDNAGTMQISNTTFANNSASSGGAIHSINLATNASLLRHITVTGNTASTSGGGIHELANLPSPPLNIQSSIVAGNSSPIAPDVQGAFTSLGHNLIGKFDGANGFTNGVNADIVGSIAAPVAANLQPCGNFGGIITSCPPLPSSRAINNGAPSPHALDQRGLPRAIEGKADIGATDFNLSPAGLLQADGTRLLFAPSGAYSQLLKGFGGDFSFSGIGLPAFLSITPSGTSSSEATLSGTIGPAQAGVYNFTIVGTNVGANAQGFTVTNNYKLVAAQSLLNVDNSSPNTIYDAATDGALIVRYLLGMRGPALVSGVLGSGPNLRSAAQIETYLADLVELFDVDGDGKTLPMTDGLMILRRILMPTPSTASAPTITANAKNSAKPDADIVNAIDALKP
jgi:predicted outer membrane repeat protein